MLQPQHTHTFRKEIGFGVELALSQLGEPHKITPENNGGYTLKARATNNPLASLRATSEWTSFAIFNGNPNTIPAGVRKIAFEITEISNPDAPAPTVSHRPEFFRGAEQARYYGVDQLTLPDIGLVKGAIPDYPIAPENLCYWFDFTDPSVVFTDYAGTILAGEGDTIRYVKDKGRAGYAVADDFQNPEYNLAVVNGLNAAANPSAGFPIQDNDYLGSLDATVNGFSTACVVRAAQIGSLQAFWAWTIAINNLFVWQLDGAGSGEWEFSTVSSGSPILTGKAGVVDEWVWLYSTVDPLGNFAIRAAGEPEVTGSGIPVPNIPVASTFAGFAMEGFDAEFFIWDTVLDATDKSGLIADFDSRYGAMPF
jgi:hypothetical protein